MTSVWSLLLVLAAIIGSTTTVSNASLSVNIATIVSVSTQDQANLAGAFDRDQLDFVLVGNSSIPSTWIDNVAGLTTGAESKVLFQTLGWSLVQDGSLQNSFSSYWARFQALDASVMPISVCTMVVEWDNSWQADEAMLSAVEVNRRLTDKCAVSDTIALAFTSAVSKTVASYLEGETTVNDAHTSFKMHDVHTAAFPEVSNRLFVRLADGVCPSDNFDSGLPASNEHEAPVMSLFMGKVCVPNDGPNNSQASYVSLRSSNDLDADWQSDLYFIIPICVCVFVIGCATLIYLFRQEKKKLAQRTQKQEVDENADLTSVYALCTYPM